MKNKLNIKQSPEYSTGLSMESVKKEGQGEKNGRLLPLMHIFLFPLLFRQVN